MAFLTIEPMADLSETQLLRAIEHGPPEVAIVAPHQEMLVTAGLIDVQAVDVTDEFSQTQQAWIDAWSTHEQELVDLLGAEAVEQRENDRQAMRSAIDQHLLRRTLYIAHRPDV